VKRGSRLVTLFSPEALALLPSPFYWRFVQTVVNDLTGRVPVDFGTDRTAHEIAYVRWTLLIASVLGGWCNPGAENQLLRVTLRNVMPLVSNHVSGGLGFIESNARIVDFVHPLAEYATLTLIYQRLKANPTRNHAPRIISQDALIAPSDPALGQSDQNNGQMKYRRNLIKRYIQALTTQADIPTVPLFGTYIRVSRYLLSRIYSGDTAFYLMGGVQSKPLSVDQLSQPDLLTKLRSTKISDGDYPE
jgi:hypothetical protein